MTNDSVRFIGRASRGHNAIAQLSPIGETRDGVPWTVVNGQQSRFPPRGLVELRGTVANGLHDGDLVVFGAVPNDLRQSKDRTRAVGVRRLLPLLELPGEPQPERQRRMFVEVGLDEARAGPLAVRVGPDWVAALTFTQGPDGRWRAGGKMMNQVPLRLFDPGKIVELPEAGLEGRHYDYDAAVPLDRSINWSRDEDYLLALVQVIQGVDEGQETVAQLENVLRARADALTGEFSVLGGSDLAVLNEIVRSGALADRLVQEAESAAALREAIIGLPQVAALAEQRAAEKVSAAMPSLIAAERGRLEKEMQADREAAAAEVKALIASLEAEELAVLDAKRAAAAAELDVELSRSRASVLDRQEAEIGAMREEKLSQIAALDADLASKKQETLSLEARSGALALSAADLQEREAGLLARVEQLASAEASLTRARHEAVQIGLPRFEVREDERLIALDGVAGLISKLALFSPAGVEAALRIAVAFSAGEVPVVHGVEAVEFVEVLAALFAADRLAAFPADPTIVTFEDLWSRAGSTGQTTLAAAARACLGAPSAGILGVIIDAERSGARFWYPALRDAVRRGTLPRGLMLCVTVADVAAEEATALLREPFAIEATGLFAESGGTISPIVFDMLRSEPRCLTRSEIVVAPATGTSMLTQHGSGLGPINASRLVRCHAAASMVMGEAAAAKLTSELAESLRPALARDPTSSRPHIVSRAVNA